MGKKKIVKKGKKPHKNKPTSKKYLKYQIKDDKVTRQRFCPRCGPGVFLMHSQGRYYCGKCHYSEFEGKKAKSESVENSNKNSTEKVKEVSNKS